MPGIIERRFWLSPKIRGLTDTGKLLACYLMTGPHHELIGAFYMPRGYISSDLAWTDGMVAKCQEELVNIDFANWCPETDYVFIPHWLCFHPIHNGNQARARMKQVANLPRSFTFADGLHNCFTQNGQHLPDNWETVWKRFGNGSGMVVKIKPNHSRPIERERERDRESQRERDKSVCEFPTTFNKIWDMYPDRKPAPSKKAAYKAFKARLNAGCTLQELAAGVLRYRAYCDASDQTGTKFVQMASTFFGPDEHWKLPWVGDTKHAKSKVQKSMEALHAYVVKNQLENLFQ